MASSPSTAPEISCGPATLVITLAPKNARTRRLFKDPSSTAGQTYRVERTTHLANAPWTPLADNLAGTGAPLTVADPATLSTTPAAFYRVLLLP